MDRLAGKICLVTGAGGAIGSATVKAFSEQGAIVIATDLQEALLAKTKAASDCQTLVQDVTSEAQWVEIVAQIAEHNTVARGAMSTLANRSVVDALIARRGARSAPIRRRAL